MKNLILTLCLCTLFTTAFAQCVKNATCKSLTGRYVKNQIKAEDIEIKATITFEGNKIILATTLNGDTTTTHFIIKKVSTCNWAAYMVAGNATYKVVSDSGNGILKKSIVRTDASNGDTKIYFSTDPKGKNGIELDLAEIKLKD